MAYTPVAQLKKKETGYIPIAQLRGEEPKPEIDLSDIRLGKIDIGGFGVTTSAILPEEVVTPQDILKVVAQGTARQWAATGAKIAQKTKLVSGDKVDPKTFFGISPTARALGAAVFGREEPFNATSEDVEFLEVFGVPKEVTEKFGGSLTLLFSALDVTGATPFRGAVGLVRALKRADNLADAAKALRSVGFVDEVIESYAPLFVKAKKTKEVKNLLDAAIDIQSKTTKIGYRPVKSLAKEVAEVAPRVIDKTLEPLEEARKFSTAEEFVEAQPKVFHGKTFGVAELDFSRKAPTRGEFGKITNQVPYGVHFTGDKAIAESFATGVTKGIPTRKAGEVVEATITARNPFDVSGRGIYREGTEQFKILKQIAERSGLKNVVRKYSDEVGGFLAKETTTMQGVNAIGPYQVLDNANPTVVRTILKEQGFDPVIKYSMRSSVEPLGGGPPVFTDAWVVLDKSAIKTKSQLTDFYNQAVRGVEPSRPPIKRPPTPRELGITPPLAPKITRREDVLLRQRLRAESQTAKAVATEVKREDIAALKRFGAAEKRQTAREISKTRETILTKLRNTTKVTEDIRKDITDYVKETLDPKDRGKAITLVRDAKTQKNLTKAFARINRWAEEATRKATRDEVIKLKNKILDSPSIAIDYKARVKELLGDFELKGHKEETLERLKKTSEFLKAEAAKGKDVTMPRRVLKALEILNRTPFDEITLSQLQGLQSELEILEELGRTKFRTRESLIEIERTKILGEIRTQGAEPINNTELLRPEIGERLTITQKMRNLWIASSNQAARIDKAISPMDTIFDLLDGGKGTYDGANFRFFKSRVDADYGKYLSRKTALQEPVIELAIKNNLDIGNFERIGVVAAREQDGGMEKLIASNFTEQEINAVKLTKEEQEVLDLMRKTFDSQFPEIQEVMRTVYNQPVEKVKNYFSFMTDWKAMDESEVFQRFGSQAPEQFGAPRKTVEVGFTKARVGGKQKIKINAMEVFMQHTDNTSYLLEVGETSKMLGEVAATPEYAELVGDAGQLLVREWVDVIARKGGAAGASTIPILDVLRKNVGIGILGLKLSTIAIQPTALIDGMGFIGVKYGQRGVTNFATDKSWREFVMNMPEVKDRMGGEFALRELTDENWLQKAQKTGFIPMQTLDQLTAGAIAAGAYERKMIELGRVIDLTKGYDAEALAYAQLAVRRTQSSGQFKDVPLAISRGALTGNRSLDRAMLQFQNFLLTRWSRIRHDAIRAGIATGDPKKAIPVLTAIIFAGLAAAGIRLGVNKALDFITGREDKDEISEDLAKGFFYEMTGNVPFLGTAVSMAMYDGEMFPILDAPKGVISGLNRVITSKSETAKLRGFAEFAGSTGALLGIPGSMQAEQIARRLLEEEKAKAKGGGSSMNTLLKDFGLPPLPELPELPSLPKLPALTF